MVEPPFEKQDGEADAGDGAPEFHIRALDAGGGDLGVLPELQFVSWLDVAFFVVQQIGAEPGVVGSDEQAVDALLEGIAKNKFARIRIDRDGFDGAAGKSHLRFFLGADQAEPESVARLYEKLLAFGVGW